MQQPRAACFSSRFFQIYVDTQLLIEPESFEDLSSPIKVALDVPEKIAALFHLLQWRALIIVHVDDFLSDVSAV